MNGDTTVEPNETFFVNVSNVTGATVVDGQGVGTITNDDVALTPIHDIQGNGLLSPLDGSAVTTRGIVTALKFNNGFFIQEPDATIDADPATSEGLFVYTGSAPTVAVGDLVQVAGTVDEYVQSGNFGAVTELVGPLTITVVSTGNPLPAAIAAHDGAALDPAGSLGPARVPRGDARQRRRLPRHRRDGREPRRATTRPGPPTATATASSPGVARPFREAGIALPERPALRHGDPAAPPLGR